MYNVCKYNFDRCHNKMDKFIANFICILMVHTVAAMCSAFALAIGNKSIALLTFISDDYVFAKWFFSMAWNRHMSTNELCRLSSVRHFLRCDDRKRPSKWNLYDFLQCESTVKFESGTQVDRSSGHSTQSYLFIWILVEKSIQKLCRTRRWGTRTCVRLWWGKINRNMLIKHKYYY